MMAVSHPAAKMLVELAKSQDAAAGDGTTSVTVIAGALLAACAKLLARGMHPTAISDGFAAAADAALAAVEALGVPVDVGDRAALARAAATSLSSKVVAAHAALLAPMAVDAVLAVTDPAKPEGVDLRNVRVGEKEGEGGEGKGDRGAVFRSNERERAPSPDAPPSPPPFLCSLHSVSKLGGTIDDSRLIDGLVFDQSAAKSAGGPTRVEGARVGLIQFCLSPPKTDIENSVVVGDYAAMDRVLRDERNHILGLVKRIKAAGCNVLLVQKSILRDATTDLALHYLAKAKIMCVRDVEREEVELVTKALGARPVAHIDGFTPDKLGSAALVEEVNLGPGGRVVQVTGVAAPGRTACVLLRASNALMLDEAARSLHDALCVIRCLVVKPALVPGGGAPEAAASVALARWAKTATGAAAVCGAAFADALDVVPYTLAENAGLNPIDVVSELRARHAAGERGAGVDVRRGGVRDVEAAGVVQPLLVSRSALALASECVRMILKIDDIVPTR
jgi:T-complex protein 1 subunit delta